MKYSSLFILLFSISLYLKTHSDTLLKTWVENKNLKILLNNNNKKTVHTIAQFNKPLKDMYGWASTADRAVLVHMNQDDSTLNASIDRQCKQASRGTPKLFSTHFRPRGKTSKKEGINKAIW